MDKPALCLFGVKEVRLPCSTDTGLLLCSIILTTYSYSFCLDMTKYLQFVLENLIIENYKKVLERTHM